MMNIRPTTLADIPALQAVLDSTALFPGEMLPGMVSGFLSGKANDAVWLTCELAAEATGFCYAVPEKMTDGTWNMLVIAVRADCQGRGAGSAILRCLETTLRQRGARILLADTSGVEAFRRTRSFYERNGYTHEARIRDFWAAGNDKIVFRKAIAEGVT